MAGLMVAVAMAGCAGEATIEEEPEAFQSLQADAKTGVIRGVVVDESITPVPGATVDVMPGELSTVTDEDGAFGFSNVEPGVYFLTATAADHSEMQTSVEVAAGVETPEITRMMLTYQPPALPYIQTLTTDMLMSYAVSVAGSGLVVGPSNGASYFAELALDGNTTYLHSELVWTFDHPLADTMQMDVSYAGINHRSISVSPNIDAYTPDEVEEPAKGVSYTLFVEDSSLVPVGFTTEQRLTLYTFGFHQFVPDEGWSFEADGAHPVPQP